MKIVIIREEIIQPDITAGGTDLQMERTRSDPWGRRCTAADCGHLPVHGRTG